MKDKNVFLLKMRKGNPTDLDLIDGVNYFLFCSRGRTRASGINLFGNLTSNASARCTDQTGPYTSQWQQL